MGSQPSNSRTPVNCEHHQAAWPASLCRNSNAVSGEATHQDRLAHALPTSDPDLAFIVGLWDRLADECKRRLIAIARANMPTESTERTTPSER